MFWESRGKCSSGHVPKSEGGGRKRHCRIIPFCFGTVGLVVGTASGL